MELKLVVLTPIARVDYVSFFCLASPSKISFAFPYNSSWSFRTSGIVVLAYALEFLGDELRLLIPRIFYWVSLDQVLNCNGVDRTAFLLTLVIYFSGLGDRLKGRLCLDFNWFLNNLFTGIKLLPLLLHRSFNQGFDTFLKKSNKVSLFCSLISIKFQ